MDMEYRRDVVHDLAEGLARLPDEVFSHLQYLQPQIGCFNRCAFCSQEAGPAIWQLSERSCRELVSALAEAARIRGIRRWPRVAYGRVHRPGVVFPYLDNDIMLYPYLDTFLNAVSEQLGAKVRVSTVGYSSCNRALNDMHQRIAKCQADVFAGLRISLTPYTYGWTTRSSGFFQTSRVQFIRDLANLLATYRHVIERLAVGKERSSVELRFPPLIESGCKFIDEFVDDYHLLVCGPHLFLSIEKGSRPKITQVTEILNNEPVFDVPVSEYLHKIVSPRDDARRHSQNQASLLETLKHDRTVDTVKLIRLENADGEYYAADPFFKTDRTFCAIQIYPTTRSRLVAGYSDATRFLLNALVRWKKENGFGARDDVPDASFNDIEEVRHILIKQREELLEIYPAASVHIGEYILPLVEGYSAALRLAGFPASLFFSPRFTIDTGQIVNQGRAKKLFKGLVTEYDEPTTPREERGYGRVSLSSMRGYVWRIAPTPHGVIPLAVAGGKNEIRDPGVLLIEELDPRHLRPIDRGSGKALRRYLVEGVEIEQLSSSCGYSRNSIPGAVCNQTSDRSTR